MTMAAIAQLRSSSPLPPGPQTQPIPPLSPQTRLTNGQQATFETDGYLVIPNALDERTVAALLGEARSLLANFSPEDHPISKFRAGDGADHIGDDYFLTSGDKVRFFFEEGAFDESGALTKHPSHAINKIGHYLHVLSPPFASILSPSSTHSPGAIARSLGFRDPRCLQSMIICKQPEIGGAVPPHQDSTFLYTDPPSAVGFWYALEDATGNNGTLSFLRGSHRWAPVEKRFVRQKEGGVWKGTEFVDNEGRRFPRRLHEENWVSDLKAKGEGEAQVGEERRGGRSLGREEDYVVEEVKAGTLVLIHGNLLHKSEKNTSQKGRLVYTFHVIEGDEECYDERNWLQPPKEGFTKI